MKNKYFKSRIRPQTPTKKNERWKYICAKIYHQPRLSQPCRQFIYIPSGYEGYNLLICCQLMSKLTTQYDFHELFPFWYVQQYKYGSALWWEKR